MHMWCSRMLNHAKPALCLFYLSRFPATPNTAYITKSSPKGAEDEMNIVKSEEKIVETRDRRQGGYQAKGVSQATVRMSRHSLFGFIFFLEQV